MATLKRISITGLKGVDSATHELRGLDVFAGKNGSGKTTRLLAVRAGLEGGRFPFLPEGDAFVQVGLTYDSTTILRTLSPKHSVSAEGAPTGIKACEAWIADTLGTPPLDFTAFLRVTPGERQKTALALCHILPEGLPATRKEVEDLLGAEVVSVLQAGALTAKKPEERPMPVPAAWEARDVAAVTEWLGLAVDRMGSTKVYEEREIKSIERSIADLVKVETTAPDGNISEAKERAHKLALELAAARGALQAHQQLGGSVKDTTDRVVELEATMDRLRTELRGYPAAADTAELDARIAALKSSMGDLTNVKQATLSAERENIAALDAARQAERSYQDAVKAVERAEKAAESFSGGECSCCGRPMTPECRGGPEAAAAYARALEAIDPAAAKRDAAQAEAERTGARLAEARDFEVKAIGEAAPLNAEIAAAEKARAEVVSVWQKGKAEITASGKAARAAADEARRALDGLPTGTDPEILKADIEGLEAELVTVQGLVDAHQRAASREEERARWARQRNERQSRLKAVSAASKTLKTWRGQVVTAAIESLAATANAMGATVFPALSFCAVGTEKGTELRLRRPDGVEVPIEGWADSETLVFGVACAIALAEAEGWKWRCIMVDEVQKLDPETFRGFMAAMAELLAAGRLDNVLLAGALTAEHLNPPRETKLPASLLKYTKLHRIEARKAQEVAA